MGTCHSFHSYDTYDTLLSECSDASNAGLYECIFQLHTDFIVAFAAEMPWWKILWLAVLAGIYLSFGGALLYFVAGQMPEVTASVLPCTSLSSVYDSQYFPPLLIPNLRRVRFPLQAFKNLDHTDHVTAGE